MHFVLSHLCICLCCVSLNSDFQLQSSPKPRESSPRVRCPVYFSWQFPQEVPSLLWFCIFFLPLWGCGTHPGSYLGSSLWREDSEILHQAFRPYHLARDSKAFSVRLSQYTLLLSQKNKKHANLHPCPLGGTFTAKSKCSALERNLYFLASEVQRVARGDVPGARGGGIGFPRKEGTEPALTGWVWVGNDGDTCPSPSQFCILRNEKKMCI